MKLNRLIEILEKFKDAEKGLDKDSQEFHFLPKEKTEFYFDLLEDDYEFIKKFQMSDRNLKYKYRITAKGYEFLNRHKKTKNPIGFR